MKFYQIILFVSLIIYIYTAEDENEKCYKAPAKSADDCQNLKTTKDYCCYVKGKLDGSDVSMCAPISKDKYDNIKDYIKELEDGGADVDKFDCKSIYLELSVLSFILLLL